MSKIYVVTAENEEVSLIVCYASTEDKAVYLSRCWLKEVCGEDTDEYDVYEFMMRICDTDRIGFDDHIICGDYISIDYQVKAQTCIYFPITAQYNRLAERKGERVKIVGHLSEKYMEGITDVPVYRIEFDDGEQTNVSASGIKFSRE